MHGIRNWCDLTPADLAELDPQRSIAVLPVGAVEQHGPHLPLGVDSFLCQAIIDRAAASAPADLCALVLPLQPVGKSNEHQAFAGTLSLSAQTLTRLWFELGACVARAGLRKLLLLNGHGGQVQIMDIVARDLRVEHRMFAVTANLWAFPADEALFPEDERRHGIHAGAFETSMMLHLRPQLVRRDKIANFVSASQAIERDYRYLRPEGSAVGFGWQIQDLNPHGACGNALQADAGHGATLVEAAARGVVDLLQEMARYPLAALRD